LLSVVGVVLAFTLIIVITVRKINFGVALLAGSFVLGISSGFTPQDFMHVFILALSDPETINLCLLIALIGFLGFCLKETGLMTDLIEGLGRILSNRSLLALIPGVIGMMPMPGGALLSAPFIDDEANRLGVGAEMKTFINLWFRHISFLIYPLSTPLIMAVSIAHVNIYSLIAFQLPLAAVYILIGYLASIRPIKQSGKRAVYGSYKIIVVGLLPILLAISLNAIGIHLAFGLVVGIAATLCIRRVSFRKVPYMLRHGVPWGLVFVMATIMVFRYVIQSSKALDLIFSGLRDMGVPQPLFLTLFPFLIATVVGSPWGAVGICFPLLLPTIGSNIISVSLLYISVIFGYLLSPLHLCLILTLGYFRSKLYGVYRMLIPVDLSVYLVGLGLILVFMRL